METASPNVVHTFSTSEYERPIAIASCEIRESSVRTAALCYRSIVLSSVNRTRKFKSSN